MKKAILILFALFAQILCAGTPFREAFNNAYFMQPAAGGGILVSNLIAHWKMNDNAASTDVVESKGSNTGTAQQTTDLLATNGIVNGALYFNGYSDIVVADDSTLPSNAAPRTTTCWINTTQTGDWAGSMTSYGSLANYERWDVSRRNNCLYFQGYNADFAGTITINDGNWHFIAVTYDGTTVALYVDTVADSTMNLTLNTISGGQFQIGCNINDGEFIEGAIDDVRVYSTVLTATQLGLIYNGGSGTEDE